VRTGVGSFLQNEPTSGQDAAERRIVTALCSWHRPSGDQDCCRLCDRYHQLIENEARKARAVWKRASGVSAQTKAAQSITKIWQGSVRGNGFDTEVLVAPDLKQGIDVLVIPVAYEMKVSQYNLHHEFYKDIFEVVA
jgi:hypothetical protein